MKKVLAFSVSLLFSVCMLFTSNTFAATTINSNQTGTDGLFYSFWSNGSGSSSMTLNGGGSYSVNWSNVGDFTCGKGWSTGSGHTISYSGTYNNSGGGSCGVYGWSTNPLVEYYICDSWNGVTYNATKVGTVTSDGSTYSIYKHQQVNQPSIQGNATFWQYISVRDNQRVGGTINIQNHFDAWKNVGLNLGSLNYQILLVEGWNGSGNANITVSEGGSSSGGGSTSGSSINLNSWQCDNRSSNLNVWNGAVGSWNVGDWIEFNNVNLSGATSVNLNLAAAQGGSFKLVTDSYSGTQIGTVNFNSTGGWNTYNNQSSSLNGASGTHNLYLICTSGTANVGTITISGSSNTGGGTTGGDTTGTSGSVYLTFDDGPSNSNSQNLINTLKSNGVNKASFFVIGQNIASNQTGWNAYKASGFSLQNHSQTHQHMTSWSYQQVYNDLSACNSAIQNGGASKPTRVRLPYLESNSTIQQACSALGLSIVSPTVDSQDWNNASTQQIITNINNLQAGGNPLMHDWPANTVSALPTIIQNLKNRGLGFAQY